MTYDPTTQLLRIDALPEVSQLRNATLAQLGQQTVPDGTYQVMPGATVQMLEISAFFQYNPAASVTFGIGVMSSLDGTARTMVNVSLAPPDAIANNTDRPGDDGYIFDMNPSAPEEENIANCSAACAANSSCVAWVYVRPTDAPCRCCLKSSIPPPNPNACCVSAVKSALYEAVVDRTASTSDGELTPQGGPIPQDTSSASVSELHIFVDHSVVEAFIDGGRARITSRVYPTDLDASYVALFSYGSSVTLLNATVYSLTTIW